MSHRAVRRCLPAIVRRSDAFDRVIQFGIDHPITPAIPAVTTLFTDLGAVVTALGHHADDQEIGRSAVHGGTAFRQIKAEALLEKMRPINQMARALNLDLYPGVREQFRMPKTGGYRGLIARAQAFLDNVSPIKAVLTARGLPADFDEQLEAARTDLATCCRFLTRQKSWRYCNQSNPFCALYVLGVPAAVALLQPQIVPIAPWTCQGSPSPNSISIGIGLLSRGCFQLRRSGGSCGIPSLQSRR
jgi:hypothetical protein